MTTAGNAAAARSDGLADPSAKVEAPGTVGAGAAATGALTAITGVGVIACTGAASGSAIEIGAIEPSARGAMVALGIGEPETGAGVFVASLARVVLVAADVPATGGAGATGTGALTAITGVGAMARTGAASGSATETGAIDSSARGATVALGIGEPGTEAGVFVTSTARVVLVAGDVPAADGAGGEGAGIIVLDISADGVATSGAAPLAAELAIAATTGVASRWRRGSSGVAGLSPAVVSATGGKEAGFGVSGTGIAGGTTAAATGVGSDRVASLSAAASSSPVIVGLASLCRSARRVDASDDGDRAGRVPRASLFAITVGPDDFVTGVGVSSAGGVSGAEGGTASGMMAGRGVAALSESGVGAAVSPIWSAAKPAIAGAAAATRAGIRRSGSAVAPDTIASPVCAGDGKVPGASTSPCRLSVIDCGDHMTTLVVRGLVSLTLAPDR